MGFNFGVTYSERYLFWQRGTPAVCRGVDVEGRRGNCVLTTLYIVAIARIRPTCREILFDARLLNH